MSRIPREIFAGHEKSTPRQSEEIDLGTLMSDRVDCSRDIRLRPHQEVSGETRACQRAMRLERFSQVVGSANPRRVTTFHRLSISSKKLLKILTSLLHEDQSQRGRLPPSSGAICSHGCERKIASRDRARSSAWTVAFTPRECRYPELMHVPPWNGFSVTGTSTNGSDPRATGFLELG